jgi:hypothetical protein
MDLTHLAPDRDQGWAVVNMAMKLSVPYDRKSLCSWRLAATQEVPSSMELVG